MKALTTTDPLRDLTNSLANTVAKTNITVAELGPALQVLTRLKDLVKDLYEVAVRRQLTILQRDGAQITDKGTLALDRDGWHFEARPTRTGLDPKRFENILRARGKQPAEYMDAEITYKMNADKTILAVERGVLTTAELETCRYERRYSVQPVRAADTVVDIATFTKEEITTPGSPNEQEELQNS